MLLGRLGSGGMGRVYLARSPGGRMVAVKVIRANLAEDVGFRARFAREVAAARKVGGLFTAQVVDADLDGPVPWLVTAYVPSTSLSDAVERQGPLPSQSVLALAAGLAEGVSAIHAAGVIHRDLKPSNVLLAQDGPRIIDFGISSAAEATSLTGTGYMIGSPGFMSPEQAEGLTVGPASDIFSLAGVLIYAARGEGPFGIGDTAALLYRVVHGTPNIDKIPDNIRPLISRSLSRDANRRPTATEFLTELTAAYPSAADLSDWLSPRLLGLSGQGATSGDSSFNRPGVAGTFGPAFDAEPAEAAEVAGAGGVTGSIAPEAADPATGGDATIGPPTQTSRAPQTPPPPTQGTPPPGLPGAEGHSGHSGQLGYPGQQSSPGQLGYPGQQSSPGQLGYPGQQSSQASRAPQASRGIPASRGIRELGNTLRRRGMPPATAVRSRLGVPGLREAPGARTTSGGQLGSRAGRPRACHRSLSPARQGPGHQEPISGLPRLRGPGSPASGRGGCCPRPAAWPFWSWSSHWSSRLAVTPLSRARPGRAPVRPRARAGARPPLTRHLQWGTCNSPSSRSVTA